MTVPHLPWHTCRVALTSTMHRFHVELSDVDRGVYESLDLRVAQHPSESVRRMLARVLAYLLAYEEGIDFGRGLSDPGEPAVAVKDLTGRLRAFIDVGFPSPERLHRASKTGARVAVYVYAEKPLKSWLADLAKATIHQRAALEIWLLPGELLDDLESRVERTVRWNVTVSDGRLYIECGDHTAEGTPERRVLD